MEDIRLKCLVGLLIIFRSLPLLGAEIFGLSPSTTAMGHAEALTSIPTASDALYYNPAALAQEPFRLGVIGIEAAADKDSMKKSLSTNRPHADINHDKKMELLYEKLNSDAPTYFETTVRPIDLVLPYFAFSSFISTQGSSKFVNTNDRGYFDAKLSLDAGLIGGAALKIGPVALGYSQYRMSRARIDTKPTPEEIRSVHSNSENYTSGTETAFRDFTDFWYGGAIGHNYGMLIRPWKDNPTGIGVALLNAGQTRFSDKSPISDGKLPLLDEATKYDITVESPPEIPQLLNVGITCGFGSDGDLVRGRLSVDYDDIGGDSTNHKEAMGWNLGLFFPKSTGSSQVNIIHGSFHTLGLFGGLRRGSYITNGVQTSLMFGLNYKMSLFKIELEFFERVAMGSANPQPDIRGVKGLIAIMISYY